MGDLDKCIHMKFLQECFVMNNDVFNYALVVISDKIVINKGLVVRSVVINLHFQGSSLKV